MPDDVPEAGDIDLTPLYTAVAEGTVADYLQAHPEMVDDTVAEAARADVRGASGAGRPDIMFVAATAAAFIFLRLGKQELALTSRLDAAQARFGIAETLDAYDVTRTDTLSTGAMGMEIGSAGLVFRSWVLAADCSWFASEVASDDVDPSAADRLIQALRDVADALESAGTIAGDPAQGNWLQRLASLLAVTAVAAMERYWPPERTLEVEALLRRLARGSENLPIELDFEGVGGAEKAAMVAAALAKLDERYSATSGG